MAARPIEARTPNVRLQVVIEEAGCSNAGLARRVNMCGREHGLDLRYDKTSVARWLRGQRPRGQAPAMIAEALGRKLGRAVTLDEVGMADSRHSGTALGLIYAPTVTAAIEQVCELWRADVGRREVLTRATPVASALVEPSRDWLISAPGPPLARTSGRAVTRTDVIAVRETTATLATLDRRYGSGHYRPVTVHYLNSVVSGLLAGRYDDALGRELLAAAARMTELAGGMAADTGLPGVAQRYYVQALRLADAAGDRAFGGYVLAAGMSRLAAALGNHREVVQLARTAREGTRDRVPPRAEALFSAAEARGAAGLGDEAAFREAAGRARAAMEQAESGGTRAPGAAGGAGGATGAPGAASGTGATGAAGAAAGVRDPARDPARGREPAWLARFGRPALAYELACALLELGRYEAAQRRAEEALAGLPESSARLRCLALAALARAQCGRREPAQACRTGARALRLLDGLASGRAAAELARLARSLEPYEAEPAVREFTARCHGLGSWLTAAPSR
ncbi:transcriptional regulator [Streptomyces sp. WAC 06738]|uniref:transcriptional regulator n=1 Tax=Streptomyces sp. WAC 06738 TaxID=2203210 RepID=UPI0013DEAC47|nr:transcriptional regulator [Streptomyces sp. WAC 06738]